MECKYVRLLAQNMLTSLVWNIFNDFNVVIICMLIIIFKEIFVQTLKINIFSLTGFFICNFFQRKVFLKGIFSTFIIYFL